MLSFEYILYGITKEPMKECAKIILFSQGRVSCNQAWFETWLDSEEGFDRQISHWCDLVKMDLRRTVCFPRCFWQYVSPPLSQSPRGVMANQGLAIRRLFFQTGAAIFFLATWWAWWVYFWIYPPPPNPTTVESESFKGSTKRVLPRAIHVWHIYQHLVDFYGKYK